MNRNVTAALCACALAASSALACTVSDAVCAKEKECAADPPGEDFERVCAIRHKGQLDALRANKEQECAELANAKERLDACRASLDCNDYDERDLNGRCDDELDDLESAWEDAADTRISDPTVLIAGPYLSVVPEDCSALD